MISDQKPKATKRPTNPLHRHWGKTFFNFDFFCFPYLSSIHKKANCIAIFWTERPHSLGSCRFRSVSAICLSHTAGGVPLSALPKDTTSELAGLFSTICPKCRAPTREAVYTIFDSTRELNPRSTNLEADALTTTPSRRWTFFG